VNYLFKGGNPIQKTRENRTVLKRTIFKDLKCIIAVLVYSNLLPLDGKTL